VTLAGRARDYIGGNKDYGQRVLFDGRSIRVEELWVRAAANNGPDALIES